MSFFYPTSSSSTTPSNLAAPNSLLVSEPLASKSSRAYLLASEVNSATRRSVKEKARSSNSLGKVFSTSDSMPEIGKHIRDSAIYTIQQTFSGGTISSSATVPTFATQYTTLSLLDDAASLGAVFDQYRIDLVETWFISRNTETTSQSNLGLFTSVIDYDDASVLTTTAQAMAYQNSITSRPVAGHYHRYTPHVAIAAYSGAFTSFANEVSPWIDVASNTVQHYGTKTAWSTADSVYTYDVIHRLTVSFRSVR